MTRSTALLTIASLLFLASGSAAGEWIDLLGGDSLGEVWKGYGRDAVPESWTLEEGVLSLNGTGGDLVTRGEFGDFDFRFEWNIEAGGNSGVMYRVVETDGPAYETGPEYQVLDPDYPGVTELTGPGALYALYPAPSDTSKPAGEWNTGRIVSNDGVVEHWINGQRVVFARIGSEPWKQLVAGSKFAPWTGFAKNATGRFALQDHGSKVSYRNLRVKRLDVAPTASATPTRVLFVTQSAGFQHSTVTRKAMDLSHTERVLQRLGVESGEFRVDCTQDVANDFTPEQLAHYDVVAFYSTGKLPIPDDTLQWFLDTWLAEQGHAVLGFHSAADTYKDHEPYWDMIGGTFDGHPWTANTRVVLKVHDGSHPASHPWGESGTRVAFTDEIYQFSNWQPEKVRVLMSLDMERTNKKRPRHVPVLWVKPYGAGRVLHMSLGHREEVWENPTYQESILGGLRWLTGKAVGDATPNPEVSAQEEKLARAAVAAARKPKAAAAAGE